VALCLRQPHGSSLAFPPGLGFISRSEDGSDAEESANRSLVSCTRIRPGSRQFRSDEGRVVLEFHLDLSQSGRNRLEPRTRAKVPAGPPSGLNPIGRSSCTAPSSATLRSSLIGDQHGRRSASPRIRGAHTLRVLWKRGWPFARKAVGKRYSTGTRCRSRMRIKQPLTPVVFQVSASRYTMPTAWGAKEKSS